MNPFRVCVGRDFSFLIINVVQTSLLLNFNIYRENSFVCWNGFEIITLSLPRMAVITLE
jgi:hypothetical protein